ncbi:MAG: NADP-dependent oxidoreductase [Gammaproteobacteria bacterium]|nr:NADP-dependent oxidoreductase [Gammaproteobacteria bacterium]
MQSKAVTLKQRPVGMPQKSDFDIIEVNVPEPVDGEIQVQNLSMSVDPYMRGRMVDRKSYVPPFQIGEVLSGGCIGRVVQSNHADFSVGDHVTSHHGWRESYTAGVENIERVGHIVADPSAYLGAIGMPGMTAYVGLLEVGALKEGETVFVSGAAGAVGSIVGQIAKLKGCRVIGSAGSQEKVDLLTSELGFDYAFNYKDGNILNHLRESAPDGLDVYFDNVGADHLQAAIMHMRPFGRIPLCGAIALYNDTEPRPGPNNLTMAIGLGLTLRGFIVSHFNHLAADFRRDMENWVTSGQINYKETIYNGIDQAPDAFIGLFTGANTGKMIVNF